MTASELDRRIRSLRPSKALFDPYTAHGSIVEEERRPDGKIERSLTAFLVGAECAFTCSFCDLWQWTVDGSTIPGALTTQLRDVLALHSSENLDRIKVYNASNFFDLRSVPPDDVDGIAELTAPFRSVTVESHANTVGQKTIDFARRLRGRLEVAVGLETVNPVAAAQLNKRLDIARFDASAELLVNNGIDLRVFVLLGTPFVPVEESIEWTVRTVAHAADRGAAVVSIIPVRRGNGELERLESNGDFVAPTLSQLERALDACSHFTTAVVTADLWDVERLPACAHCQGARVARMRRFNVNGVAEARIACEVCHG